ncbi:MAG: hypothetical protein E7400_02260 [Ruminococcaceae bacterium]|nr:hypothetical protein [Oscillospiraceae bacterium]
MLKKLLYITLCVVLLLTGCSLSGTGSVKGEQKTAMVYYANAEGTDLVSAEIDVRDKTEKELPRYVIETLLEGPSSADMSRSVRAGTKLLSLITEKSLARVDLSKEFYHEESVLDVLSIAAIVKSLCSVNSIDQVLVTIEGQPLISPDGTAQGILKESDVVFVADTLTEDEANITLYFSDANAECLVSEIRRVKLRRGDSLEQLVMQELIRGPELPENGNTVPTETKIRSIETKDKVCFVNLSSEFVTKNPSGISGERMTVYSIVNSLTELSGIDKVQFLIEGEKKDVYLHMTFNEPIERDVSMIQK